MPKSNHTIHITVQDKIATALGNEKIVCGNSDYVAVFAFDNEWNAQNVKTARFITQGGHYTDVVFSGSECPIPALYNTRVCKIGVYAGDLMTTTPAYIDCDNSILCGGGTPADPQPDVYAQLMKKIDSGMLKGEKGETGQVGPAGKDAPQIDDSTDSPDNPWSGAKVAAEIGTVRTAADGTAAELAETKAELATARKALAETQRAVRFAAKLSKGQTWDFETDDAAAYSRQIPSGAYAGAVQAIGGRTVAWNQLANDTPDISGIAKADGMYTAFQQYGRLSFGKGANLIATHKYYIRIDIKMPTGDTSGKSLRFDVGNPGYTSSLNTDIDNSTLGDWKTIQKVGTYKTSAPISNSTLFVQDTRASDWTPFAVRNPACVDLTQMFGEGNEPTTTDDPRIAQIEAYAQAHPEYNGGELVSAAVEDVQAAGRNLIDDTKYNINRVNYKDSTAYAYNAGIHKFSGYQSAQQIDTSFGLLYAVHVEAGKIYRLSFDVLAKNAVVPIYMTTGTLKRSFYLAQADGSAIPMAETNVAFGNSGEWNRVSCTFAATLTGNATLYMTIDVPDLYGVGSACWYKNIQFTAADITAYAPYHNPALYPIPESVKALPGYGWSAGDICNSVERTETGWQYVQRVARLQIDADVSTISLSNQNSSFDNDASFLVSISGVLPKIGTYTKKLRSLSCNTLTCPMTGMQSVYTTDAYAVSSHAEPKYSNYLYIRFPYSIASRLSKDSTSAEKEAAAKAWFTKNETIIYYEQEPVPTDITALMADALAPFATEPGGSITLHHALADDGLALDVPGTVQYVTKLSEVVDNG